MTQINSESKGPPPATATPVKKLNAGAKSFFFSPKAAVWTPSSATKTPTTTPSSNLKKTAKTFVPKFSIPAVPVVTTPAPETPQPAPKIATATNGAVEDSKIVRNNLNDAFSNVEISPKKKESSVVVDKEVEEQKPIEAEEEVVEKVEQVTVEPVTESTEKQEPDSEDNHSEEESSVSEKKENPPCETPAVEVTTKPSLASEKEVEVLNVNVVFIRYKALDLMQLRPVETPLPECMVNCPILKTKESEDSSSKSNLQHEPRSQRRNQNNQHNNTNNYNSNNRRNNGPRRDKSYNGRGKRYPSVDTAPPLEDCEPLKVNEETRWKPSVQKKKGENDDDSVEKYLSKAKSVLNKLSIEKFERLSDQIIEVAVHNQEVLSGCIDFIIKKAQMEWHFSAMYAELCFKMSITKIASLEGIDVDTNKLFRQMLLTRCQKEFEECSLSFGEGEKEKMDEVEIAEKEHLLKRASLGHIRFVGELYKHNMLSSKIMHTCIQRLFGDLNKPDEEDLECLCKLLTTIGKNLDVGVKNENEYTIINSYYKAIKTLSNKKDLICVRLRFMLKDLIELRASKWVARRKEDKAMTIAEIHAEIEKEEKAKQSSLKRHNSMQQNSNNRPGSLNRRKSFTPSNSNNNYHRRDSNNDGWETVPGKSSLKSGKSGLPLSNSGRHNATFSRQDSASRSNRRDSHHSNDRFSKSDSRKNTQSSRQFVKSQSSEPRSSSPKAVVKEISRDSFKSHVTTNLKDYFVEQDMEETVRCMKELSAYADQSEIFVTALNVGYDKGNKERCLVGGFLNGLHNAKILSQDNVMTGLNHIVELLEELEMDIPLAIPYTAVMLAPCVISELISVKDLVKVVECLTYRSKAANLVADIINNIKLSDNGKVYAEKIVGDIDFLPLLDEKDRTSEGLAEFLAKKNL